MNYEKIYFSIIEKKKAQPANGYSEKHHILPKSLGGSDDTHNIVRLSAREHFICHWLLVKIHRNDVRSHSKMLRAFAMMCVCKSFNQERITSKVFERYKQQLSKIMSDSQSAEKNSQFSSIWISNPTTNQSKKISRTSTIETGWVRGRNKQWMTCIICQKDFLHRFKKATCSDKCLRDHKKNHVTSTFISSAKQNGYNNRKIVIDDNHVEYISVTEASERLKVCYQTVLNRIKKGIYFFK